MGMGESSFQPNCETMASDFASGTLGYNQAPHPRQLMGQHGTGGAWERRHLYVMCNKGDKSVPSVNGKEILIQAGKSKIGQSCQSRLLALS